MKNAISKVISACGYRISKIKVDDIDLYQKLYKEESIANRRFYNIGAGGFSHPAWTNVDHSCDWYGHLQTNNIGIDWDLLSLKPIPVESNCAEVVYSSHTVEHITDDAAQNMFNEAYRILKKGGYLRVQTPNIDLTFRAYKENDRDYFDWVDYYSIPKNYKWAKFNRPLNKASIGQLFVIHFATAASTFHIDGARERITDEELDRIFSEMEYTEGLNYCVARCPITLQKKYPGNHINWWNEDKMSQMLTGSGFRTVYLSAYGQSFCPVLRNTHQFDHSNPKLSLYVEAIK